MFLKHVYILMQGIKPGPVNDMVIISARPRERRLAEGIRNVLSTTTITS